MKERIWKELDYIYKDEMLKLEISVEDYISANNSRGVSQMIGRRYGNLWERLVKCIFQNSIEGQFSDKVYYKDYVDKWVEENTKDIENDCCKKNAKKLLYKFLQENTGTATQDLCDFTFFYHGKKYAIDTKIRFVSNDSNTVREIANSAHHLKYMGYIPVMLFRKKREESISAPVNRFEREGWLIKCDKDTSDFIREVTGNDLECWIDKNMHIWSRLEKYQEGLMQLRFGKKEWDF